LLIDFLLLHLRPYQDFIQEFLDQAVTFREQFPNGEERLLENSREFFDEYDFEISACSFLIL